MPHPRSFLHKASVLTLAIVPLGIYAQQQNQALNQRGQSLSVDGKWHNFVHETANPSTIAAGLFNGAVAHVTNSDPKYGTDGQAFAERVGASTLNIVTQNFFGDFVMASAFHEDPRYFPKGQGYGMWSRAAYAISRAWLIRTDSGATSFNWSNAFGAGMSTGLSYTYFPAASKHGGAMTIQFASDFFGSGFANIATEFWPDIRQKVFRRH